MVLISSRLQKTLAHIPFAPFRRPSGHILRQHQLASVRQCTMPEDVRFETSLSAIGAGKIPVTPEDKSEECPCAPELTHFHFIRRHSKQEMICWVWFPLDVFLAFGLSSASSPDASSVFLFLSLLVDGVGDARPIFVYSWSCVGLGFDPLFHTGMRSQTRSRIATGRVGGGTRC